MTLGDSRSHSFIPWRSAGSAIVVLVSFGLFVAFGFSNNESTRLVNLLPNTFLLAFGTCLISLPLGTALAILIARTNVPGRSFAGLLFTALLFVPILFSAAAWHAGFGKLSWYTFTQGSLAEPILSGWSAAVWIHAIAAIPWVMLIVGLGLRQVEPEFEEEALLDGSAVQVFFRVTLVRTIGPMIVASLWIFVMTAGEITVTDLCAVRTVAEEIFQPDVSAQHPAYLTSVAIVMMGLALAAAFGVVFRLAPSTREGSLREPSTFELGAWRSWAAIFLVLMIVIVVVVPMISLFYQAGADTVAIGDEKVKQWSAGKLIRMLTTMPIQYGKQFAWTAAIGFAAATVCLSIAFPFAWLARNGGPRAWPALIAVSVCCAVPGPLIGKGLLAIRDGPIGPFRDLLDYTIFAPTIACVIRALPITILIFWYSLRSVGKDQFASSSTEGAGAVRQMWDIAIRQRLIAIAMTWLIAFALASGDLSASYLAIPPGIDTIPRAVFGKLHSGVDDQAAGICLVCIAGFTLIAGVVMVALKKDRTRPTRK